MQKRSYKKCIGLAKWSKPWEFTYENKVFNNVQLLWMTIVVSASEILGPIDEMTLLRKWRQNNASHSMILFRSFAGLQKR